ncbi:hypothetical protein C1H57_12440 [Clostridium sp. 2-1]|uniref:BppU family phage baseplate upper protein n=1 Tax=Clostridium TaxID=1485 RepID=UPI000CDB3323|nr:MULTISPECIES: BppU family phage baseplate upper protein [Clostridium]MBN7576025.1 BppU family phage baseplate upper protein [Clostridium beijerinckii]MBN7581142.1 BppU family phage baseplate upper protein [Clostridium beijerinckii]MBN7585746.1 BppU family phage baseplate upper protein [Clostridium beijerinckii]MBO0521535.1 BppU family phage baseplate upper protein [Clostridium beijerinckii]POO90992.1 hypothetical protein C1H57_12440 [Clostridium sp. 2-1]
MQRTLYIPIDTTIYNTFECEKLIKRGDTLTLQLQVYTNGVLADLTGQKVDIILEKSDGNLIQKIITDVSNGTVTAVLDLQATNVPGEVNGELQLTDSNSQTSTNTFIFTVDESIANDVLIYSKPDIEVLNNLRAMITDTENMITKYAADVSAISNSIEAIEALENIKAYININLQALEDNNAQAVINNKNLIKQISEAIENITILTDKNAQAETDIKNLTDTINTSDTTKDNLDNSISTGNTTKSNIDNAVEEGNTVIETIKNMDIAYTQHINNDDIHVTKMQKDRWDLAALNVKEIINILDKTVGIGTLDDENGEPWVDENNEQFIG